MIISYEVPDGYSFSKWFAVQDAETGEIITHPMKYADDRIGLMRLCRYGPGSQPEKGIYCWYRGPDGQPATETIRRPIKIVVGEWVKDPKDREFAEHLIETYRDWRPDAWDDERINGLKWDIAVAFTKSRTDVEIINECSAFIDRFRAMQGELSARAIKPERPEVADDEPSEDEPAKDGRKSRDISFKSYLKRWWLPIAFCLASGIFVNTLAGTALMLMCVVTSLIQANHDVKEGSRP